MSESQSSWIGRTLGGRYQIDSLLGHGGMSSVYKATDPNLQRTVAIKLIHPHLSENPEFVKRFEQEAAAVAQLRHPNIMQVHDFNHDQGAYYIVFEYIAGESLEKRLAALKEANLRLPLGETIRIMITLCGAVAYAHERNMIHRDLKPSNVMLNLLGEPILLDFGIAKIVGGDHVHTATGATIGTATYMSPEQAKSLEIDHRADIYSLGIMLYEMSAGKPPYEGESALTVMLKHMQEPIPDIRQINQNVPDILIAILENALAKNPEGRFRSAMHMASALQVLTQEPSGPTAMQSFTTNRPTPAAIPPAPILPEMQQPAPTPVEPAPAPPPPAAPEPAVSQPAPAATPPAEMTPRPATTPAPRAAMTAAKSKPAVTSVRKSAAEPSTRPARVMSPILWGVAGLAILGTIGLAAYFLFFSQPLPSSEGMVSVPAATYTVGSNNSGSQYAPVQEVELDEFWIDRFEVTNAQYAAFLADTGSQPPSHWTTGLVPDGLENHPIQGVTWDSAVAYCQWENKRLPSEAEWEVAARGPQGFLYPWGNSDEFILSAQSTTHEVGTALVNQSVFGAYDLAGNVWEWVGDTYAPIPNGHRLLHGGAFDFHKDMAYRLSGDPAVPTMVATAGFRCGADRVELVPDEDLLLDDDFTDPGSGWVTVEEESETVGYHPPDYYHVQSGQSNHVATSFFGGRYDDISMVSDVFVDSTDSESGDFRYGLALRRDGDQYYAFTLSPRAGLWYVLKSTVDGIRVLAQGDIESLQGGTSTDRLRVDASGSHFAFSINGQVVTQLDDGDYVAGEFGFVVETFDETRAHVHYDSLTVRKAASVPVSSVLLRDDFADPESGWPSVTEGSLLSGYHPPAYYHLQSGEPNHRSLAFFDQNFEDVVMEAEVFVDSTDTEEGDFYYGLAVRRQGAQYYGFLISPRTKAWQVIKNSDAGQEVLAEGSDDAIEGFTIANRLRAETNGDDLIFYIEDHAVARLNDGDYRSGEIGFIVETLDESRAHIHYDIVLVR